MAKIYGFSDLDDTKDEGSAKEGLFVSAAGRGTSSKAKVFGFSSSQSSVGTGSQRTAGKAQIHGFGDLSKKTPNISAKKVPEIDSHDQDYLIALQLQMADLQDEDWKAEDDAEDDIVVTKFDANRKELIVSPRAENLTDPEYDLVDPCPDIHALFQEYDKKYFWSKLGSCVLEWSKRMTICAGIFYLRGGGTIRLSQKLLQYRPRKNLVETLLHEMIHAYLYLTRNFKDRDGHGDEFKSHMNRINALANTNITIYHTFHDEVAACRQHVWRCNGTCRTMAPFFGYVKRSMNRAPSKNDRWWPAHQAKCTGTFEKVAEPDEFKAKQAKKIENEAKKALKASQPTTSASDSKKPPKVKPIKKEIDQKKPINAFFKPIEGKQNLGTKRKSDEITTSPPIVKQEKTINDPDLQIIELSGTFKKPNKSIKDEAVIVLDGDIPAELCQTAECPMCGKSFPTDLINTHVNSHF